MESFAKTYQFTDFKNLVMFLVAISQKFTVTFNDCNDWCNNHT